MARRTQAVRLPPRRELFPASGTVTFVDAVDAPDVTLLGHDTDALPGASENPRERMAESALDARAPTKSSSDTYD